MAGFKLRGVIAVVREEKSSAYVFLVFLILCIFVIFFCVFETHTTKCAAESVQILNERSAAARQI